MREREKEEENIEPLEAQTNVMRPVIAKACLDL